ncbi:hypothetical protein FACS189496_1830 [Bacilli bacterium]|nr:hypothetical protein FACS189496_1830 [Bacilli bacterium]
MSQYESNLLSIGTLLSLNEDNPADKLLLSCFNDIQKYVYEDIHKFKFNTDFSKVPRNKMPIMKEFYFEGLKRANKQKNVTVKEALEKLCMLLKEHAIGISAPLFNSFTNID